MSKFYKVLKDTFMWEAGAILKYNAAQGTEGGYEAISDVWDRVPIRSEYISRRVIEHPDNADSFQRVYEVTVFGKAKYLAKTQAKAAMEELHKLGK